MDDFDSMTDEQLQAYISQAEGRADKLQQNAADANGVAQQNAQNDFEQQPIPQTAVHSQPMDIQSSAQPPAPDFNSMTDDQLQAYISNGDAQMQKSRAGQTQMQIAAPSQEPTPTSEVNGNPPANESPWRAGLRTFFDSLFTKEGREESLANYREDVRNGGAGMKIAGVLTDLGDSMLGGLASGGGKITEAIGNITNNDDLVESAKSYQGDVQKYFANDMVMDNAEPGKKRTVGEKVYDTVRNVASVTGEFAPSLIPFVGKAYAYSLVGAGGVNTTVDTYKTAKANGLSDAEARMWAGAAGVVDVVQNALLMHRFRENWKGVNDWSKSGTFMQSFVKNLMLDTAKNAGIMGAGEAAQNAIQQMTMKKEELARQGGFDISATGNALVDGAIQGALFAVVNKVAKAPMDWSKYKVKQEKAKSEDNEKITSEMKKSPAEQINAQKAESKERRRLQEAERAAFERPDARAILMRNNPDATLDIIFARRSGENVTPEMMDALGLPHAWTTQEDLNRMGDYMLEDYDNANAAQRLHDAREVGERDGANVEAERVDAQNRAEMIMNTPLEAFSDMYKEALKSHKIGPGVTLKQYRKGLAEDARKVDSRISSVSKMEEEQGESAIAEHNRTIENDRFVDEHRLEYDDWLKRNFPNRKGADNEEARELFRIEFVKERNESDSVGNKERAKAESDREKMESGQEYVREEDIRENDRRHAEFMEKNGIMTYEQWLASRGKKPTAWEEYLYRRYANEIAQKAQERKTRAEEPSTPREPEPAEPTKPREPEPPAEPTEHPTEPAPEKPAEPTEPPAPPIPTKPVEPTAPTAPTKPVEPSAPTSPTAPSTPFNPKGIMDAFRGAGTKPTETGSTETATPQNGDKGPSATGTETQKATQSEKSQTAQTAQTAPASTEPQTPAGYATWLASRRSKKDRADTPTQRKMFDMLVKNGKIDAETGKKPVAKQAATETAPQTAEAPKTPTGATEAPKANNEPSVAPNAPTGKEEASTAPTATTEPPNATAPAPKPKSNRKGPNAGYSYEDYAAETGDHEGADSLRGLKFKIPNGLMEYRTALARWEHTKSANRGKKPTMSDFGVVDPMADWINNFLNGASKSEKFALFGFGMDKGSNDGIEGDIKSPIIEARYKRLKEQYGTSKALEMLAEAKLKSREKFAKWRDAKRTEENDRKAEDAMWGASYDELEAAHDAKDAEWDGAIGEIESGGFGENGEYLVPFSHDNLLKARQGDTIHFDHDANDFVMEGYDAKTGTLTVRHEDSGEARTFRVSGNHAEEIKNGRREEVNLQDHAGDARGEQGEGGTDVGETKPARAAFKRGDTAFVKDGDNFRAATFVKDNGDGTSDIQVKTPGRNRFEPTKVETRTVKNGELKSTGMRDTLTKAEKDALEKNREVAEDEDIRDSRRPMTEDEGKDLVAEANKRLAKLVPGITVRRGELSDEAKAMGSRAQFNRSNGEVLIGTNADYIDAVHEIGAHAVRLWAEKNMPELFKKTLDYALNAPKEIKEFVFRNYGDFNGDALLDEIFAHRFMKEHGEEFRKMLEKSANRTWWGKMKDGVREMYRRIAGKTKVDLDGLDKDADAEKWMDAIAEQIVAGKRFGGRNAVTGEMDGVRRSIPGIYTGSAADYEKPSLVYVGTGDGSQVYGWGLYGSKKRSVAEDYASRAKEGVIGTRWFDHDDGRRLTLNDLIASGKAEPDGTVIEGGWHEDKNHANLYEQTFFTNRAPGDESHLLSWYEPVSEENKRRILNEFAKTDTALAESLRKFDSEIELSSKRIHDATATNANLEDMIGIGAMDTKPLDVIFREFVGNVGETGAEVYKALERKFGGKNIFKRAESAKAASEFLARADIDGIKYPVDSYGGKTVKDGDKAGWNYVSFRDDNINVDHKWVDGEKRFSRRGVTEEDDRKYADAVKRGDSETALRMIREAANVSDISSARTGIPITIEGYHRTNVRFMDYARTMRDIAKKLRPLVDEAADIYEKSVGKKYRGVIDSTWNGMIQRIIKSYQYERKYSIDENVLNKLKSLSKRHSEILSPIDRASFNLGDQIDAILSKHWEDPAADALKMKKYRGWENVSDEDLKSVQHLFPEVFHTRNARNKNDLGYFGRGAYFSEKPMSSVENGMLLGDYLYHTFVHFNNPFVASRAEYRKDSSSYSRVFDENENSFNAEDLFDMGYDGVITTNGSTSIGDGNREFVAYNPSQIKSADITYDDSGKPIPLSQRFNQRNGDIRYSRGPRHPNPNPGNYMDKEETAKDKYLRNFSDRYDPIRTVVVDAQKAGGMSDEAAKDYAYADESSPYHAERVQTGLAERDLTGLRSIQKSFENILKLKNVGITNEEIGEFMYATHAPDRNAQKLRDHGVTDGSGMTDADAASILAQFQRDGKTAKLQRAADVLWKINDEYGLDFLEKAQLLDHDSVQRLKTAYGDHYTPLRDDFTEDGVDYNSRRAPDASAFKGAVGRFTKAENPVAFMILQGTDNIVRAHENMTRLKLAEFVRRHPEMGRVREATQDDMKNGGSGIVFFRENATAANGNTYNRRMAIELFGKRGNDIASSVNGTTVVNAPKQVQALSRWWASFATQLSPTFSMRNFIKDTVEVAYDTLATMGARPALSFLRRQAAMMPLWNRETRRVFKEFRETGKVTGTSQVAKDFQKFIDAGGLIGGGGAREGYTKMTQDFDDITKQLGKAGNTARSVGRVWDAYKDWVSGVNESIETLTRFNNFANRLHANGGDAARAAMDSREGSTDFNMHGDQRWMNSVWMFSNSILGGSMRAAKSLAFGKYGRNLAVGMLAMGMLEELANSVANSDEDSEKNGEGGEKDITEYERANSWRFRWGGHYVKIPQHLGPFSVIKYAGNNIYRAMTGQITAEEALKNVANEVATIGTHFTGTGEHGFGKGSPSLTASLMPSAIVQPLVQVGMNEDYKGAKIYREHEMGGAKYDPDWKYAKKDTSWLAVQVSKVLNRLPFTGGSDNRKGISSVPPETLEYLSKQIVKNFGTDVINSVVETPVAIARSISEGENVAELKNTPFARDFYKKTPDVRGRYYDAMEEIEAQQNEFKKMPPQEKSAYIKEHPNAAGRLSKLQDKIKHLSALSQGMSMNAHGSKREVPNMSQKQKDMYEKSMLKLMAQYVRLAGVN